MMMMALTWSFFNEKSWHGIWNVILDVFCCLSALFLTYVAPSLLPTVRIGAMLAYTPLDEKSLALLLTYLQDFLK